MYVVTVLTASETAQLETALVNNLRNAWGGADIDWLMPDVAAEFHMQILPDNHAAVWEELQKLKIDMCIQEAGDRKKKLLLADMDSTMIQQECIDELASYAGVGAQVADITARAMNGDIQFEGALKERVALLQGLNRGVIESVLAERISYTPGGKQLVSTMKKHGAYAALVSGGFTAFTGPVAQYLAFDEHRSNQFVITDGILTGEVSLPIVGKEAKVEALNDLSKKLDIQTSDVLAVGDGANDLGMLTRAGMGVALHAKPSVQKEARFRINHGDLTALLFLQGYRETEFAR